MKAVTLALLAFVAFVWLFVHGVIFGLDLFSGALVGAVNGTKYAFHELVDAWGPGYPWIFWTVTPLALVVVLLNRRLLVGIVCDQD